jgi:hypothetical protein
MFTHPENHIDPKANTKLFGEKKDDRRGVSNGSDEYLRAQGVSRRDTGRV